MKFSRVMVFLIFFCGFVYSQDFQKVYVEFMKSYDYGDYVKSFKILDDVITKYDNVPEYFYIKSLDSLNMGYIYGRFSYSFFTNTLYRYYGVMVSRNIYNGSVWEKFVEVVDDSGLSKLYYEGLKNLFFVDISNENALFYLVRKLFSDRNYSEIVNIYRNGIMDVNSAKVAYLVFLSKIYEQDYSNFDSILKLVAYNYDSDDIRYIVSSVYYSIMDFDNAWRILMLMNNPDPDLKLKLMILRNEAPEKIKSFISDNKSKLDRNLVEFVNLVLKGGRDLVVALENKLSSYSDVDNLQIALALRFPKNSRVYGMGLEKTAIGFFYKKMYDKVIQIIEDYPKRSKILKLVLGISYFYEGEYIKALRLFREIEDVFFQAKVRIPYIYFKLGMEKEAIEKARSLVKEIKEEDDVLKYFLARVFLDFGDFKNFDKVMSYVSSTNHYMYLLLHSHKFFMEKKYVESEKILVNLIESYPYNSDIMNSLAYVWAEQGKNLVDALKLSKFSLVFDEDYNYLDTLAYIYYRMNDLENAREAIERSIDIMEKKKDISKVIYLRASMIYRSLGDEGKSKIMLNKANRGKGL